MAGKGQKRKDKDKIILKAVVFDGYTDFIFLNRDCRTFYHGSLNKTIRRIIRDCNLEVLEKANATANGFQIADQAVKPRLNPTET